MDIVSTNRQSFTRSNNRLKRARALYARLVRREVMLDRTGKVLHKVADRAVEAGFYSSKSSIGDVHWSILNYIHKIDKCNHQFGCFYTWFKANGWRGGLGQKFYRVNV